ncbi:MAG: Z1 domain-containing protein [Ruminococcus sp.]
MVNQERVNSIVGIVRNLIEARGISDNLTEEIIDELIKEAIGFVGINCIDEELEACRRDLKYRYMIKSIPGSKILNDYNQDEWYSDIKDDIQQKFWLRYKDYLIDEKHFSPNVVSKLGNETLDQDLMNYLLNPNIETDTPVLRRGLVIGDVQSGKTSTYIGLICKAADAGFKVFILLAGTIESLRKQTQERVEEGFIGIDMSDPNTGGKRVGVGLDNKDIFATALTSRNNDFTGNSDKIAVALKNFNAVVFVIKKQKDVLNKLTKWLINLNADTLTKKIDLPMLMIDDEADNASINTSKSKEDPTTINRLIRNLANLFTRSNYIGFTATPFANVFIDPETTEEMENQDLFPEDFIVSLPTPSNYIGPEQIFAENGEYHSQLIYITDAGIEESDGHSFYFKHKKEWEGELPESLTDAIYSFYIVNAIRDLRGDKKTHRSMLVNMSRFVRVQKYIRSEIENIHSTAYREIKFNLSHDFTESMKSPVLEKIYSLWERHFSDTEFDWDDIVNALYEAVEPIMIKAVNSAKGTDKLVYPENESIRVIAIGGLALSRGLTLEGLIISYFYRNTCTYDVLMQMGRWFGYRRGYEDLFRIWTHRASAEWYAEISKATEELKSDMRLMNENKMRPKDFGIRVKNDADDLQITAANKMRNSKDELLVNSYFGNIIETPYLVFDPEKQKRNYYSVKAFIEHLVFNGLSFNRLKVNQGRNRLMIQDVPKYSIIELFRKLYVSNYNSHFNLSQIITFLSDCDDTSIELFDIAFVEGNSGNKVINIAGKNITTIFRGKCRASEVDDRLNIGRKGKLGGPGDGIAGIVDTPDMTADKIIENAKNLYKVDYKEKKRKDFPDDATYPGDTWFKYVKNRKPLLIIYLIDVEGEDGNEATINKMKESMSGIPSVGFALGFPENDNKAIYNISVYRANKAYNWFELNDILAESEEEE